MTQRSFSNYLLYEGVIESLLTIDNTTISSLARSLLYPQVNVVEEDCGTTLGLIQDLNFSVQGDILVETGEPITYNQIYTKLGAGVYSAGFRSASTCTSSEGICAKCAAGSNLLQPEPGVGSYLALSPLLNYATLTVTITNLPQELFLSTVDYDLALVIHNGQVIASGTSGSNIVLQVGDVPINQSVLVRYYISDSSSLLSYFAKSYSGALLGIKSLDAPMLTVPEKVYETIIPDEALFLAENELRQLNIDARYLSYIEEINNKLEKALAILYFYATFAYIND